MVKLLLFYFNLYLFFIIYLFNFNLFSKVLIDKNIKDIFLEEIEFEGIKNTGNKLEVVENNESIKVTDNYFIAIELEFDKTNNKYIQKNKIDDNLKDFNLEIIKNKDGTFEKIFKDKSNNNIKEYEIEGNCGHLFYLKDVNNKGYFIYLTNLYPDIYIFCDNKKIVEFKSIYCFGYNIKNNQLFEGCENLKIVKYDNFNKNSINDLINYRKKNPNDFNNINMFLSCSNLEKIDLSNFICNYFDGIFINFNNLKVIKINNSIDSFLFNGTFYNCKNLRKIFFTNKNKIIINSNTFKNCENLEDLGVNDIYLDFGSDYCFENCKKMKNLNLNINNKYLRGYNFGNNLLKNTNLDNLNIIIDDNFNINQNIDYLEKILEGAKIKRFTFNNIPINVKEGCNLREFMLNPIEYLRKNKQYICEDYKLPKTIEEPNISNNTQNKQNNKNELNKDKLKCLSCCSKICCCCSR